MFFMLLVVTGVGGEYLLLTLLVLRKGGGELGERVAEMDFSGVVAKGGFWVDFFCFLAGPVGLFILEGKIGDVCSSPELFLFLLLALVLGEDKPEEPGIGERDGGGRSGAWLTGGTGMEEKRFPMLKCSKILEEFLSAKSMSTS